MLSLVTYLPECELVEGQEGLQSRNIAFANAAALLMVLCIALRVGSMGRGDWARRSRIGEEERAAVDEIDTACSQEALGLEKEI